MKRYFFFALLTVITIKSSGQLVVNNSLTPAQLANMIAGPGINVYNVSFTGDPTMAGSFNASGTNLGISEGVMLASGDISFAVGPNLMDNAGNDMNLPGDSILDTLAGGNPTFDACILEFDFVPQSSQVTFRYIFGSEEYPEYVCSDFNDIFAFFISGPGISGLMNLALIPSTSTPVAINTVNNGSIGIFGNNGSHCNLSHPTYYVDNMGGATIELDGFTVPMIATVNVTPCQMYHLRIMIADATDGAFDSGVFLEEGSLFSNPVVNAGLDQTICTGMTAQLGIPSAPGYTYNWSPPTGLSATNISNPTATLVNTGSTPITQTYVVVANSGTCLFNDTVKITVNPLPSPSFNTSVNNACINTPFDVTYTGLPAAVYNWNFGSANVISGSGAGPYSISYPANGTYTITVDVDAGGCTASYSQVVTISGIPPVSFSVPPSICLGSTAQVSVNGIVTPGINYNWDFNGGQIVSGSGGGPYEILWSTAGAYSVSLNVDSGGCVSPFVVNQVNVDLPPVAFAGSNVSVCPNTNVSLGEPATAGNTYLWSPSNGLNDPQISNPVALLQNTGNDPLYYNFTVTVTSAGGCVAVDDVTITVIPAVNVTFTPPPDQCIEGNSFSFSVDGNYPSGSSFLWDFGPQANILSSTDPSLSGISYSSPGIHTVTLNATSGNCTMLPVSHSFEVHSMPVVDFSTSDLAGCAPLTVSLQNLSGDLNDSFQWSVSEGSSSNVTNPLLTISTPGIHDVSLTATSIHGCTETFVRPQYLNVYAQPVSSFIPQPLIATIEAPVIFLTNNSVNADQYHWDFGDNTTDSANVSSHSFQSTGDYLIMLIAFTQYGCADTSYASVEIIEGLQFFVPNAFSPNGDGVNDFFQGYGINIKDYQMSIFNRWGEKIFETDSYEIPWDGKSKDAVLSDTYVYRISIIDKLESPHEYVGKVSVVK